MLNRFSRCRPGTHRWPRTLFAFAAAMLFLSPLAAGASELRLTPVVRAVQKARPSIVNIHGRKTAPAGGPASRAGGQRPVNGMGTGVIIDPRGYIITNYHVIEGVSKIQVTLHDKRSLIATRVAHDPKTDLAIIKIPAEGVYPTITIGTSSDLMPGEPVIAVGNAFGYEHTVTRGIISALHRTVPVNDNHKYYDLIQTDASINPGNSGGPLLNIDGEMIGINVAVRVGAQGIGFAIPVDKALESAAHLLANDHGAGISHGVVGVTQKTGDGKTQFVVQQVRSNSPAETAGLKAGDVIEQVGEVKIKRALDFQRSLLGRSAGQSLKVAVRRDGQATELNMKSPVAGGKLVDDRAWRVLGLKFETIPTRKFLEYNSRYRGGLKVVAVRPGSPAAEQGVQASDVLVGMHIWETISLENISYILSRPDLQKLQPIKFYILRNNETLYGHMTVNARLR